MFFRHILAKITASCIIFGAVLLVGPTAVNAQMLTTHKKTIEIIDTQTINFHHVLEITNNTRNRIVNNYSLTLPYSNITKLRAQESGRKATVQFRQGKISVSFRDGLLFGRSKQIVVSYQAKVDLTRYNGLIEFRLPQFTTSESISSFETTLVYPAEFPELIFSQAPPVRQANQLVFARNIPIHLVWGGEAKVVVDETISLADTRSAVQQLISVFHSQQNQQVKYRTLDNLSLLSESNGNVWAAVTGNMHYRAALSTQAGAKHFGAARNAQVTVKYPGLPFPEALRPQVAALPTKGQAAALIHNALVDTYEAVDQDFESKAEFLQNVEQLGQPGASNRLSQIVMTSTLANWLAEIGIPAQIEYGYHMGTDWPSFDESLPAAWVVAEIEGERRIFEPFLRDRTGYEFIDSPILGRVQMGIWDLANSADSVLGLIGPGLRARPAVVVKESAETSTDQNVLGVQLQAPRLGLNTPAHAFAGEPYQINLVVNNPTDEILRLSEVSWDEVDMSGSLKSAGGKFTVAVAPNSTGVFSLTGLLWPTLLYEGTETHRVEVALEGMPPLRTSYSTFYTSQPMLQMGVGAATLLTVLLILLIFYRKFRLRYLQYLALQSA